MTRFFSTRVPAPPGFAECRLSKRLLLGAPLVLLTDDLDGVFALVPGAAQRLAGVLVTPGPAAREERLGELLWRVSLRLESLPEARPLLAALLEGIEAALALRERIEQTSLLAERTRQDLQVTRGDYHRVSQKLLEDLERIRSIAGENARLFEEAQAALRARDDFLSIASHELRTPLTPLRLQLQIIQRRLGELGDPRLKASIARADRQVDRLAHLVENLLDVSLIDRGKLALRPERVDLFKLVSAVVDEFQAEIERSKCPVSLEAESGVFGDWDPFRIEQVVVNLVSNALKFGAGAPIEIAVGHTDPQTARLTVRDHGIGVAAEAQRRLFQRYERAASPAEFGGLGLGLYITRQIVEAHGGTVALVSRPGEGTTLTVELPAAPA